MSALLPRLALLVPLLAAAAVLPARAQSEPGAARQPEATREPAVQQLRVEDEGSRIDELRVRGQTRRIQVQPRQAVAYEVLPIDAARDPSQGNGLGGGSRGAAGQRVWHFLSF
ncbi:hypothetical protein [Caldimonas tepidiphila]|uniref:hypothetical protein n=1 Tax=Caldimonas tepidiphila TaxID=2315841 RepID=UPI001F0C3F1D|nr:hypothetical protein [Caldimonas tepidiphila]